MFCIGRHLLFYPSTQSAVSDSGFYPRKLGLYHIPAAKIFQPAAYTTQQGNATPAVTGFHRSRPGKRMVIKSRATILNPDEQHATSGLGPVPDSELDPATGDLLQPALPLLIIFQEASRRLLLRRRQSQHAMLQCIGIKLRQHRINLAAIGPNGGHLEDIVQDQRNRIELAEGLAFDLVGELPTLRPLDSAAG